MGRGRAKAKQTTVARELKYSSGGTDLDRLRAELTAGPSTMVGVPPLATVDDEDDESDEDDDEDD